MVGTFKLVCTAGSGWDWMASLVLVLVSGLFSISFDSGARAVMAEFKAVSKTEGERRLFGESPRH